MPISMETELVQLSQKEFSGIAYDVMAEIFALHKSMGRLFHENVYRNALVERLGIAQSEVPIHIFYGGFKKTYYMDLLIAKGSIFELKTVNTLNVRHRSQLLNYLLLTELHHGKLVNLRQECVEHEFVNSSLTHSDRTKFTLNDSSYKCTEGFGLPEKNLIIDILRDWGTALDIALYREAITHFCGTDSPHEVQVLLNGTPICCQTVDLCNPDTGLAVTTFENNAEQYQKQLTRFMNNTTLNAIQWINIAKNELTFKTIQ